MKKILSAVAAFALAAALISCGGNSDEFDGKTDTVLTIGAPSVTAKAYPGVNYVTWTPVSSATKYDVYRIEDGAAEGTSLVTGTTTTAYADIAGDSKNGALGLANGKAYKYVVVALPENAANGATVAGTPAQVPTRAIYMKANQGSASVKAIVPNAGLSIDAFTDSYTKDFLKKFDEKNLAKNVIVTQTQLAKVDSAKWGNYWVSYPATAGYKFAIKAVEPTAIGTGLEAGDTLETTATNFATDYKENFTGNTPKAQWGAGKKDLYLTIQSVSSLYQPIVKKIGSIEFKGIGEKSGSETKAVTAKYEAANKARVWWTPATMLATGKLADKNNYKVYRASQVDNYDTYTLITTGDVKVEEIQAKDNNTYTGSAAEVPNTKTTTVATATNNATAKAVYSIVDSTITDMTVDYKYYVVHTDGTLYGAFTDANNVGTLSNWEPTTATPIITYNGTIKSDEKSGKRVIMLTLKKGDRAQKPLALSYAALTVDPTAATANPSTVINAFTGFTAAPGTISNEASDDMTYVYYFTGDYNKQYIFKLTASEDGKKDASAYVTVGINKLTASISNLNFSIVAQADPADSTGTKYAVIGNKTSYDATNDPISGYELVLYSVTTKAAKKDYDQYVTVTTKKEGAISLEKCTAAINTKYGTSYGISDTELVSVNEVTKPKEAALNKVTGYEHVRFFYTLQIKDKPETISYVDITNGAWSVVGVE